MLNHLCLFCGAEIADTAKFCGACGAAVSPSPGHVSTATGSPSDQASATAPVTCEVCGAPTGRPGQMCENCAEVLARVSSRPTPEGRITF